MEYPHAKDRTEASPGEGDEKERGLPDAPEMPDRLPLVNAHHGETGQVDCGEIECDNTIYIHDIVSFIIHSFGIRQWKDLFWTAA